MCGTWRHGGFSLTLWHEIPSWIAWRWPVLHTPPGTVYHRAPDHAHPEKVSPVTPGRRPNERNNKSFRPPSDRATGVGTWPGHSRARGPLTSSPAHAGQRIKIHNLNNYKKLWKLYFVAADSITPYPSRSYGI